MYKVTKTFTNQIHRDEGDKWDKTLKTWMLYYVLKSL
jgi:hypothetical protein